jgi:ankyrin repeat protein
MTWDNFQDGHTALHCACEKNHSSVAKVLLCAGAKVNAKGGLVSTSIWRWCWCVCVFVCVCVCCDTS